MHIIIISLASLSSADHDFLFHCLFYSSHFTTFSVSSLQFLISIIFYILLPLFLDHIQCNSTSQLRSSSPPLPLHFLGICSLCQFFICHVFYITCPSCRCSVSVIVSIAFTYAGVTHELGTFPLRLRDMRLSPITPSIFLPALAPAVVLLVTKAIHLVDFALGKCHILS